MGFHKTRTLPAKAGVRTLRSQNGQALIEFTIAAAALLVPLFLMLAYVAKYHDMQSATIQAARYAAWERTVYFGGETWECNYDETTFRAKNKPDGAKWACGTAWKSDADISNDVGRRFFKGSWLSEGLGDAEDERPFWSDLAGTPLLKDYKQDSLASRTPGGPNLIVDKIYSEGLGTAAQFFSAEKLVKLDMANLYTSTVTFTPTNTWAVTQAFKNSNPLFDLKENNVLVANGWSANGKNFVAAQIQPYTPTNILNNSTFQQGWGGFTKLASLFFPEFDNFKLTASLKPDNADKVPPDRLSGGAEVKPPKIVPPKPVRPPITTPDVALAKFRQDNSQIAAKILSCKAEKKAEMVRNYYEVVPPEPYSAWNNADKNNCKQYKGWGQNDDWELKGTDHGCIWYSKSFNNNNPDFCATHCDNWGSRTGCNNRWQCSGKGWAYYNGVPVTLYKPAGEKVADRPWNGYTPNSDNDHNCNAGLDARINALLPNLLNDPAVAGINEACAGAAAGIPDAARECAKFQALLDARRQERDRLISERDYMRQPLNSCSCAAGRSSSCRTTGSTYTCQ
jgi:hypothetical protein